MTQQQKTQEELMQDLNNAIKEQLVDTQEMIDLLDHTASILSEREKVQTYKSMIAFLQDEGVDFPSSFASIQAGHQSTSEELLEQLPGHIDKAFADITQIQMIRFVSDYRPGDVRPDDQVKNPKERLKRQAARFIVNHMSDEQKENLYYLIRKERIENAEQRQVVREFDEVVGYPFEFARRTILSKLDQDLNPVYDVISKYASGYTKAIGDSFEHMIELKDRDFKFNAKRILDQAKTALRRFHIFKEEDTKEFRVAVTKEFAAVYAEYMEYDGELPHDDEAYL